MRIWFKKHNNGENDLPIRMYGLVPITVKDEVSILDVQLDMPEELRPNQTFIAEISENSGKGMAYTIAVVDEGLLDLTNFKTPDLWNHFFAKQALGVKTWDMYDMVLSGYGGEIDRFISIGGDGEVAEISTPDKANRFEPVVSFLGPFYLKKGEKASHMIKLPNYVGSVRTMVVARQGKSYGKAEKATPVKKPLMLLSTLPRVLGPGESVLLPVNVFAMDKKIQNVDISIHASDHFQVIGAGKQSIKFQKEGDQQAYFELLVGDQIGPAFVNIAAKSGREEAEENIEIQIRNPNPYTSEVHEATVLPGDSWNLKYEPFGTKGTNEAMLEISQVPPLNFNKRLRYLIRYPYGCIEQTTSAVFPQLYLANVVDLSGKQKLSIESNIKRGIERLSLFQLGNGGFSYWPGNRDVSEWGSNYASHFVLEAKEKGYFVSDQMISGMVNYHTKASNEFPYSTNLEKNKLWNVLSQAYRLYILAKAGKPNIAAMNRLRNYKHLNAVSAHTLAAAYAIIGQDKVASDLISNRSIDTNPYIETGGSYGSHIRDLAMMAEALIEMDKLEKAGEIIKQISNELNTQRWYSTQTTSYSLLAAGKFLGSFGGGNLEMNVALNRGSGKVLSSSKPIYQEEIEIETNESGALTIINTGENVFFAKFVLSGQSPPGKEIEEIQKHIKMDVKYFDMEGNVLDPSRLKQGTDFQIKTTVQNLASRSYHIEELALSQIFPSGWEIHNTRLTGFGNSKENTRIDLSGY